MRFRRRVEVREAGEELRLGVARAHRLEMAEEAPRREPRLAEQLSRLVLGEARERRRLHEGREPVGRLDAFRKLRREFGRQAEPDVDRPHEPRLDPPVVAADRRLERRDQVADHVFGAVVEQRREFFPRRRLRVGGGEQRLDEKRVLGDREDLRPPGLAVPARDAREPMGDVADLDVERRRVDDVEPPPRQHPLPGAAAGAHAGKSRASARQGSCRKQSTRWSLTMPVACMKA